MISLCSLLEMLELIKDIIGIRLVSLMTYGL